MDPIPLPGPRHRDEPAEGEAPRGPSLSPSRAADFKTCPLLYRLRTIDRLPELPTPDQLRGTLVHAVLERLFDLPAAERTPERAAAMIEPEWRRLLEEEPALAAVVPANLASDAAVPISADAFDSAVPADAIGPAVTAGDPAVPAGDPAVPAETHSDGEPEPGGLDRFLSGATELLSGYFVLEDPRRLDPAEREFLVTATVDDGRLMLRGYIDRLDVGAAGELRVVDYKTGGAPREVFEARALFQLKFYALVLWRTRGVVPRMLRLLYLRDVQACDYSPDAEELSRFERTLVALWAAIERATIAEDFRPRPSRLCGWCAHQALCPAFGGTLPPFPRPPEEAVAELATV